MIIAQRYSTCLAYVRPWIQSLLHFLKVVNLDQSQEAEEGKCTQVTLLLA